MIKTTINLGDTFRDIVERTTNIQLNWHNRSELELLIQNCITSGDTQLPNVLRPGDTVTVPGKSEWRRIKSGEAL